MGQNINTLRFSPGCYEAFANKVRQELEVLRQLLNTPGFGAGAASVGAELEFYIVNENGCASPINQKLLGLSTSDQWQPELNRFNIEYNLKPQRLSGRPFTRFSEEVTMALAQMNSNAQAFRSRLVPIGILPTLARSDVGPASMTALPRYQALAEGLRQMRGRPFQININGNDSLNIEADDVTLEGANTSFQFHWRVAFDKFVAAYNAIQLITPLTVAMSANSPFLFQKSLWDETRISLFKQSIDVRQSNSHPWREPARVDFGQGWLRKSPIELFELAVSLYPPLLPALEEEDSLSILQRGDIPNLPNLRLHHGTTWTWNRAIFDPVANGHMRIELRSMPAGPSIQDMLATAAFSIGCALSLTSDIDQLTSKLPFQYAEYNFYAAARYGLHANLIWPEQQQVKLGERPAREVIQALLPQSMEALRQAGVDEKDVSSLDTVLSQRLESGITGAQWQKQIVSQLERQGCNRTEACAGMFNLYQLEHRSGKTVANWRQSI
ncbi:MAG: hypothetical protein H7A01_00895 [Hahellaceae bacterium]|nr:hypothetical protein [Hahellaceae bacterium]MCP5210858.1 hypothetical protein [Hahellaceae bacterium]